MPGLTLGERSRLIGVFIERGDGRKGGWPADPAEVMLRILVLQRLYDRASG